MNDGEGERRGWDASGQDIPREMGKIQCFRVMHGIKQLDWSLLLKTEV